MGFDGKENLLKGFHEKIFNQVNSNYIMVY